MCIFSGDVRSVSNTRIFARLDREHQCLVYEMSLDAPVAVAMVLPIPLQSGVDDTAVRFVDLSGCPEFFSLLAWCFPEEASLASGALRGAVSGGVLPVRSVGAFEASVVLSHSDFKRLDKRFRLPPSVFAAFPHYKNYSFVVFRLKPGRQDVHPMAFTYPTSAPDRVFFPTVHVHAGSLTETAEFDHTLYVQAPRVDDERWRAGGTQPSSVFRHLSGPPGDIVRSLVAPTTPVHRTRMLGVLKNQDTWVEAVSSG